jgi:hypothetical protein
MPGDMELHKGKAVDKPLDPGLRAMIEDVYCIKVKGNAGVRAHAERGKGVPTIELTSTDQSAIDQVVDVLNNSKHGLRIKVNKIKPPTKDQLKKAISEQSSKVDGLLE